MIKNRIHIENAQIQNLLNKVMVTEISILAQNPDIKKAKTAKLELLR